MLACICECVCSYVHACNTLPSQLQVFSWKSRKGADMELCKVVKFDTEQYITSISVVKNFVLYSDILKSLHFLRFVVSTVQRGTALRSDIPLSLCAARAIGIQHDLLRIRGSSSAQTQLYTRT